MNAKYDKVIVELLSNGHLQVNEDTVYSLKRRTPKPLGSIGSDGYLHTQVKHNGQVVSLLVSRIICIAFHGFPRNSRCQVNHKNGDKTDNRASNLEWSTPKENTRHAWRNGKCSSKAGQHNPFSKLTDQDVLDIRNRRDESYRSLAQQYSVHPSLIHEIWSRRLWKHLP